MHILYQSILDCQVLGWVVILPEIFFFCKNRSNVDRIGRKLQFIIYHNEHFFDPTDLGVQDFTPNNLTKTIDVTMQWGEIFFEVASLFYHAYAFSIARYFSIFHMNGS